MIGVPEQNCDTLGMNQSVDPEPEYLELPTHSEQDPGELNGNYEGLRKYGNIGKGSWSVYDELRAKFGTSN